MASPRGAYFTSAAWLETAHVVQTGCAYVKLADGRSGVVRARDGGWCHVLAGVVSDTYPSFEGAADDLTNLLANQHILLRRR